MKEKFRLQDREYEFPYHYLTELEEGSVPRVHRCLDWGLEYLTYTSQVINYVSAESPSSLLDAGCGEGRVSGVLAKGIDRVLGVDMSEQAISLAKALNQEASFVQGDVSSIEERFQAISLVEVLEHIPEEAMAGFIDSLRERIEEGGALVISVPSVNKPLLPKHYRHYTLPLLEETLRGSFVIERHCWVAPRSLISLFLRLLLVNPLYVANLRAFRWLIWQIHLRVCFFGDEQTGEHLVCVARPV